MFDPDGYILAPVMVALLAIWGEQGKLPPRLGFVHPGDEADVLELSAKENARFVLGEILASGAIKAYVVIERSGFSWPIPTPYWRSGCAMHTLQNGCFSLSFLGIDGLEADINRVILSVDEVCAALGVRMKHQTAVETRTVVAESEAIQIYRSGVQGRPTSRPLVVAELARRRAAGEVLLTLMDEARALCAWMKQNHPEAPPLLPRSLCNSIRAELREAVEEAKARKHA